MVGTLGEELFDPVRMRLRDFIKCGFIHLQRKIERRLFLANTVGIVDTPVGNKVRRSSRNRRHNGKPS